LKKYFTVKLFKINPIFVKQHQIKTCIKSSGSSLLFLFSSGRSSAAIIFSK